MVPNDIVSSLIAVQMGGTEEKKKIAVLNRIHYFPGKAPEYEIPLIP